MIKKYNIFLTLVLFQGLIIFILCSFHKTKDDPKRRVKIIVIDPGHGGKDPGCNGVSCKEKEVALAVSLKLGKLIEENIKDVKVIFTRKTDVFVELEDRAKIANDNNADLFISIHCNAAGKPVMVKDKKTGKMRPKTFKNSKGKLIVVETANPEPFGSETYVMGLKNEEGKMKVAQRENSAMLLEDNYETKYQGFDPNSEESYIIMSNYTSSYVIQSAGLALKIQEQYFKKAGRVDKGVHRQSIWVLWRTSMPSVLTEIGYLTNPQEEKFLGSEKGQSYLAACLFRAFRKYKDEQEGVKKTYDDAIENQIPLENENYKIANETEEVKTIDKPIIESDVEVKEVIKDKTATNEEKIKEEAEAKIKLIAEQKAKDDKQKEDKLKEEAKAKEKMLADQKAKEEAENKAKADSLAEVQKTLSKEEEQEKKYRQFIALADVNFKNGNYEEALGLYQKATASKPNDAYASKKVKEVVALMNPVAVETHKPGEVKELKAKTGIVFKVQFASIDKEVDSKIKYPNVTDVWFYKSGSVYKYTSGNYASMEEAAKQQAKLKELGYKDCFVAAFNDGIRMDINEAKRLTR
ncbi:MAG: N-acetylmuramoyl-L-alanine amidase [Bacteroidota bacterium]